VSTLHYTDPELVEAVEPVAVTLAEREPPSPELADLVEALATRAPEPDVQAKLTAAAEAVLEQRRPCTCRERAGG
jgi:hypothetical protein